MPTLAAPPRRLDSLVSLATNHTRHLVTHSPNEDENCLFRSFLKQQTTFTNGSLSPLKLLWFLPCATLLCLNDSAMSDGSSVVELCIVMPTLSPLFLSGPEAKRHGYTQLELTGGVRHDSIYHFFSASPFSLD